MKHRHVAAVIVSASFAAAALSQGVIGGDAPAVPRPKFSGVPFPVSFVDVARQAGLSARSVMGADTGKKYIVEANGAGVALVDYNNDGRLDIFIPNGTTFIAPPAGAAPISHLYRNDGGMKFTDVSRDAGVARTGWGNGVCSGDFDNDGNIDLYVTYWGLNSLYRGQANGRFKDVALAAGVAGPREEWSTGCTFLDYDRDGRLDLLVTSYVGFDVKKTPLPGAQQNCVFRNAPVYCGPRGLPFGSVTLYHAREDGVFEDVSVKSGIRKASDFYAFTAAAADLNGDGWTDIYVASDSTPSLFFRNNRDGTFTELATESGIAYNENGVEQAGMGVALADYDNDGWIDITKTNFIRDYPNLYRNVGKGIFEDRAVSSGLGVNPQYVLWGTGLEDFDNDGWRDLFQVAGHVYPEIEKIDPAETYANPRLLYRNLAGRFEDVSQMAGPGIAARHSSRGAAFGDIDNDGDIDVVVVNMAQPPSLLRNDSRSSHAWIKLQLQGTKSNRAAIGAIVELTAGAVRQTAPLLSQSSFLSANDPRLHFGLGAARSLEKLTVRWPSGAVEEFKGAQPGALWLLVEGSATAKKIELPQ